MDDWFRIEVTDHDGLIVAIEPEVLAGRDIGKTETATLKRAVGQLLGFMGLPDVTTMEGDDE